MAHKSSNSGNALPFKIVMLGDQSVGKTCLVNRFTRNTWKLTEPTLGQDFKAVSAKACFEGENIDVRL